MPDFPEIPPSDTPDELLSEEEEEGDGPAFGQVPDLPDHPSLPTSPGWGRVDDGGGAPAIAAMLEIPEGSTQAIVPSVRFYDIEEDRHRLWQADPHPDRSIV